ncbi:MAG: hypothetical protein CVV05_01360 [Gammaproteobacteria bacterium HGW-Gammaproteobacteria-1]|jgi:hypothetical protein|nr:MAG: hypothetical protein CVV05_01360 [Gammaproteobacteria bacterium HGW-Gammaproteobacteria-1]
MSVTKDDIKAVLGGILGMSAREDEEAYHAVADNQVVQRAVDYAREGKYEEFGLLFVGQIERVIDGLLASVTNDAEAQFLIKHGCFVEEHFKRLIQRYEGMPCCADKSRTIMRSLIVFYLEGKPICFDYSQEYTYHLPKKIFKAQEEILGFAKGLHQLFYGNPDLYLEQLRSVMATADKT